MNKKQSQKLNKYEAISMLTYLKDYLGITEQLSVLKRATHKDIRYLQFENSQAVPFECVDNDDLATGRIVLVLDSKNHIAPYKNPLRMRNKSYVKERTRKEGKLWY